MNQLIVSNKFKLSTVRVINFSLLIICIKHALNITLYVIEI